MPTTTHYIRREALQLRGVRGTITSIAATPRVLILGQRSLCHTAALCSVPPAAGSDVVLKALGAAVTAKPIRRATAL